MKGEIHQTQKGRSVLLVCFIFAERRALEQAKADVDVEQNSQSKCPASGRSRDKSPAPNTPTGCCRAVQAICHFYGRLWEAMGEWFVFMTSLN